MALFHTDAEAARWLDRPVWSALVTRQRRFAQICGTARRLMPGVGPFAATAGNDPRSLDALAHLVAASRHGVTLMQACELAVPGGLGVLGMGMGVQMLAQVEIPRSSQEGIARLGPADMAEMLALTELTEPGPFVPNTHLLGRYWGLRREGRLVAMAGERMKQPGLTEVSAICVHPGHRRQGYGARLTATVAADIQARGEQPYLHAVADNLGAIRLYETLGFRVRCPVNLAWLEPPEIRTEHEFAEPPNRTAGQVPRQNRSRTSRSVPETPPASSPLALSTPAPSTPAPSHPTASQAGPAAAPGRRMP